MEGASLSLGYSKNWLGRLPKRGVKQFNALQEEGYTGYQKIVLLSHNSVRGSTKAKTISLRDFNKLVAYEALFKKNIKAIILLIAFAEAGIERVVDSAFDGESLDWFMEKIVHYSQWTEAEYFAAIEYNRGEVKALYSWGLPKDQFRED